jgi:hypothetical protein
LALTPDRDTSYTEAGPAVDPDYADEVLSLAPSKAFGVLVARLVADGTVQPRHMDSMERIPAHRGEVAHEPARLLVDVETRVSTDCCSSFGTV